GHLRRGRRIGLRHASDLDLRRPADRGQVRAAHAAGTDHREAEPAAGRYRARRAIFHPAVLSGRERATALAVDSRTTSSPSSTAPLAAPSPFPAGTALASTATTASAPDALRAARLPR